MIFFKLLHHFNSLKQEVEEEQLVDEILTDLDVITLVNDNEKKVLYNSNSKQIDLILV